MAQPKRSFRVLNSPFRMPESSSMLGLASSFDGIWAASFSSTGQVYFCSSQSVVSGASSSSPPSSSSSPLPPSSSSVLQTGASFSPSCFVFNPAGLGGDEVPTTSLAFHPQSSEGSYTVLTTSSSGIVKQTVVSVGEGGGRGGGAAGEKLRQQKEVSFAVEERNEPLSCSYDCSGGVFVTGGSDTRLRVYDTVTGAAISTIQKTIGSHGQDTVGHNGRIFSIKFTDDFCFLSAGWGSSMLLHDTRVRRAVRLFEGPHVGGDGVCLLDGGLVAAASDRVTDQLQIFDIGTARLTIPSITTPMNLYSCSYDKNRGGLLWAAGAQPSGVVCVDPKTGVMKEIVTDGFASALYGISVLRDGSLFSCGAKGGLYRLLPSQ